MIIDANEERTYWREKLRCILFLSSIAASRTFEQVKIGQPKLDLRHWHLKQKNWLHRPKVGDRAQNNSMSSSRVASLARALVAELHPWLAARNASLAGLRKMRRLGNPSISTLQTVCNAQKAAC